MTAKTKSLRARSLRLRLYVAGDNPVSRRAFEGRQRLIDALGGQLAIELVDVLDHPAEAERASVVVTPALSDDSTIPPRRLIGDIGDTARILDYFGIASKDDAS